MSERFKSGQRVLFIGDSITDAGRTNHLPPYGGGYMSMFRNKIIENHASLDVSFINKGISGNTLEGLELRWKRDVIDLKPNHLFIMIGINDAAVQLESSKSNEDALNEFENIFIKLLNSSRDIGIRSIYCLSPFYISTDTASPLFIMAKKHIEIQKDICKSRSIPFINIHEVFQQVLKKTDAIFWSTDGVHPKEQGHMLIADTLYKELFGEV